MFMFHETLLSRMQEIFKIKKDMLLFTPQKDWINIVNHFQISEMECSTNVPVAL